MHLKTLTLKGFNSFASATSLEFEPGVTCVVGPNGSGKSNVVDALAWVMGEQGAKSLRGGKMEDVIFSGTSGRAPLGRAEVALTIDNTDGALPIEYSEVTISRTLFRNGGSEYAINGEQCRLLDIQELLSDSGIGREMHVIVGQGQLDTILHATPEDRRGFVEEAAGVLKHRKRKEKALRKLDSMEGNLTRLQDLTSELRRQLKPLGRQAEVARRAVVIQTDVRDARLRLLADDLVQFRETLEAEVADETSLRNRQAQVEASIAELQAREARSEEQERTQAPELSAAQDTWFALSAAGERFHGLEQLARATVRHLQPEEEDEHVSGRDPEQLEAEARSLRAQEFELGREVEALRDALAAAESSRLRAEEQFAAEQRRIEAVEAAAADRREGLATIEGKVNAAVSRRDARAAEISRLDGQIAEARQRADQAQAEFARVEVDIVGLDEGEVGLDEAHERAHAALVAADAAVEELRAEEARIERARAAAEATCQALELSMKRSDAGASVMNAGLPGVIGALAEHVHIDGGAEHAVAAVLGDLANAIVVRGQSAAVDAVALLKDTDAGRVAIVVVDDSPTSAPAVSAPPNGRWVRDLVRCDDLVRPVVDSLLKDTVLVDDVAAAMDGHRLAGHLTWVTSAGDVVARGVVRGGSSASESLVEVQAAYEKATAELQDLVQRSERLRFDLSAARDQQTEAASGVERALARLHESDAQMAAVAEQLGNLGQAARAAAAEADRLDQALEAARAALEADEAALTQLRERLDAMQREPIADPVADRRLELEQAAQATRAQEVDARLSMRTAEERMTAVTDRAVALENDAQVERRARQAAQERRERRARDLIVAQAIVQAVTVVRSHVDVSAAHADRVRGDLQRAARERAEELVAVREQLRTLATELEGLRDSVHRDELARAEQRMRIEQIEAKALEDFGIEADVLIAEYGPDQMVPPSPRAPGDEIPEGEPEPQPYPFVRSEQEKRLKEAERGLAVLGKVNPLALEEYSAMEERHRFLTEQLDDLKRTRDDLLDIVKEVDERVEQVFTEAYRDVEREFEQVFARLFPGGEGRLILTDPSDMLNTGIDVEARPPGKRVKRLSLLSGGERSLTAVAFLVALFKSRPSPFYVLDEVEAALDDVNLGRLIDMIEELRDSSQLIVITHQKRTMEIADALYGVSMRGDGVTQVIGQRIREAVSA
ncbi:MAG: chromosome segregation protein SMC [Actinomycetota bacterium]|nr:chromosome segregation protein SMC [Actinomycetota bacterium]